MALLPPTRFFGLKRALWRWAGATIGERVRFCSSSRIRVQGALRIGAETWIGHDTLIVGGDAEISIGQRCDIAPRVLIATGTHKLDLGSARVAGPGKSLPIHIGNGCWIGAGAILLGGTEIGSGSMVAAGAVVRGIFPSGSLIAGNPAKIIRSASGVARL